VEHRAHLFGARQRLHGWGELDGIAVLRSPVRGPKFPVLSI